MRSWAKLVVVLVAASLPAGPSHGATPSIAGGGSHSIAVRSDGRVLTWGNDDWGQLGGGRVLAFPDPLPIAALNGVVALSGGYLHTVALRTDGSVV
ncbi:MAG: RCC1 repeat-containing protein, partial [Betaproteobacteria bacterium]|nr:RCC1 repeat-containing protein [Betaproteobacteria bacterium]